MATTTRVTRPTPPAQPAELRDLIGLHNQAVKAFNKFTRIAPKLGNRVLEVYGPKDTDLMVTDLFGTSRQIDEWYATPAGQTYRRAVEAYNAQAAAWNAQIKADQCARQNDRETAAVRAARCPSCFTVKRTPDAPCVNC